ncbi:hypothetical protein L4D76_20920 [Photobacterium sagamiensis]|uniref:acyl-CoA thioester hydrolase/BAAT C-terminal domain-containing protein n=1 Tax=Photobacterium sagamiensis TaxID=2910241 RepID=UPI003D14E850
MHVPHIFSKKRFLASLLALAVSGQAMAISHWHDVRIYNKGDEALYDGKLWQAKWWSQGQKPIDGEQSAWMEQHEKTVSSWSQTKVYTGGDMMLSDGKIWQAKWWNEGQPPTQQEGDVWSYVSDLNIKVLSSTEQQVEVSITDTIANANFNYIVSVAIPVPAGWQFVESRQRPDQPTPGIQKDAHTDIVRVENGVAQVTAIPETGTLTLVPEATGEHVGFTGRVVDNGEIVADYFYNKHRANKQPLILLGGSRGGKTWSGDGDFKQNRRDLVQQGYAALSMAYFGLEGLPATLENIPLEVFEQGHHWLTEQPAVNSQDIAVMGISKGGEMSLLLASKYPEIRAVVGIVPASNVFEGIGMKGVSSWTHGSEPIPFAPFVPKDTLVNSFRASLADPAIAAMSAIPVEQMNAAVLLLSGKLDPVWPSYDMSETVMQRLRDHRYAYPFEHVYAADKGHDIGAYPEYWAKVLMFLSKNYPVKP